MRQTSPSGVVPLIKFVDMFSGIGGFREGLTRAGGFECVGHCEIDKYANRSCSVFSINSLIGIVASDIIKPPDVICRALCLYIM